LRREGLDDVQTIKVRLKEYKDRTVPVFDYFKKQGIKIIKINGENSVAEVYQDVLKAVL
jgi:adenylate kinase family enzyme